MTKNRAAAIIASLDYPAVKAVLKERDGIFREMKRRLSLLLKTSRKSLTFSSRCGFCAMAGGACSNRKKLVPWTSGFERC